MAAIGLLIRVDSNTIHNLPKLSPPLVIIGDGGIYYRKGLDYMAHPISHTEKTITPDAGRDANIGQSYIKNLIRNR